MASTVLMQDIITQWHEVEIVYTNIVGSHFAMVRFTKIHFYETCRVGPSTPDFWCITVATQVPFLYLSALLALIWLARVSYFLF